MYVIDDIIEGLPDHVPGKKLIVSKPVAMACVGRVDVMFPDKLIRDSQGNVTGCRGFGRYITQSEADLMSE